MDPESIGSVERVPHGGSDDSDLLDFSANVNPEVPPGTREIYASALTRSRSYPADDYPEFRQAAADHVCCHPDEVVPTSGGLAAIRLGIEATVGPGDTVLVPYPSFGEYTREVRLQGAQPRFVPYKELMEAEPAGHALAVICNPNNPTGDIAKPEKLRTFAQRCRDAGTPVIADEAFLGFTEHPSLAGQAGTIVIRSLTKLFGLPGLRAGFAVADGLLGDRLQRGRQAWSLGIPAAMVGAHAMGQRSFVHKTRTRITRERDRMRRRLTPNFEVAPSDAPFLLLETNKDVRALVSRCQENGIAIRDATTFRGLDSHVRVAVRLPDENDQLLEALDV